MSGLKITTKTDCVEFGVTAMPNRKSRCLYAMQGTAVETLAYFRTEEDADKFEKIIEFMVEVLGK